MAARLEALPRRHRGRERVLDRGRGGNRTPFGDQESVGRDRECRVVMEAPPSSTLVMVEADLLFQILEVALNAPPELCRVDERRDWRRVGQGGEPVLGRRVLALGPLDQ